MNEPNEHADLTPEELKRKELEELIALLDSPKSVEPAENTASFPDNALPRETSVNTTQPSSEKAPDSVGSPFYSLDEPLSELTEEIDEVSALVASSLDSGKAVESAEHDSPSASTTLEPSSDTSPEVSTAPSSDETPAIVEAEAVISSEPPAKPDQPAASDEPAAIVDSIIDVEDDEAEVNAEEEAQKEAEQQALHKALALAAQKEQEDWKKIKAYEAEEKNKAFKFDPLKLYKGMFRRFILINKHTLGLFTGGLLAFRKVLEPEQTRGMRFLGTRILASLVRPFVDKSIRDLPFPTQLRKRLELLGPTYIKLGQVLALREDILPKVVTEELKNLLDRLPEVPFPIIRSIIERNLGKPLEECFEHINLKPLGSASIAQTHLARTIEGQEVVLKVVKPGIRDAILTDIQLLKLLAKFLQWAIPQYQPKVLIDEFCAYTEKEVDLTNEADNAELFAANFDDMEGVAFPKIYREYTARDVLCMGFFKGFKPGAPETFEMPMEDRLKLVEYGAEAIIRMLYKDGFFHADLHPGNLIILDGPKVGFIDLGMTGRFSDRTRRQMLYYFNALVNGDMDGAGKYLVAMARVGEDGDPNGFRRELADLSRKYYTHAKTGDFSLAQLIMQSVGIGGKYRVFFPVEMTLMVKALVTFEGVGLVLNPKLDVPSISQKYVEKIFREQFNPKKLAKEFMRGTPELVDVLVNLPKFTSDGINFLDRIMNEKSPANPLAGLRSGIIAGACIIGGVISLTVGGDLITSSILFGIGVLLTLFGK